MGDFAPKLLHCRWEPTVGQYCVVTVFVNNSGDVRPTPEKLEQLKAALKEMHSSSYVHGDLRAPNIMIEAGHPYVIDFDWAGKEGTVVYPADINMEHSWAQGVKGGEKIEQVHDLEMLQKYIDNDPVPSVDTSTE